MRTIQLNSYRGVSVVTLGCQTLLTLSYSFNWMLWNRPHLKSSLHPSLESLVCVNFRMSSVLAYNRTRVRSNPSQQWPWCQQTTHLWIWHLANSIHIRITTHSLLIYIVLQTKIYFAIDVKLFCNWRQICIKHHRLTCFCLFVFFVCFFVCFFVVFFLTIIQMVRLR